MDTLNQAIRRTIAEAAARGGVIWVTDEAKRLEERFSGEVALPDIAAALTRESLRSGVGVRIGDAAAKPDAHDAAGRVAR